MKKCCFIGHRNTRLTCELQEKLTIIIENLIVNKGYTTFLFGSKSNFDSLCHIVVTKLKEKHHKIKRIRYTCNNESVIYESEKKKIQAIYQQYNIMENIECFEEEFEYKTKYTAGKAGYIERNKAMIDDSELCIFYYDENYEPSHCKSSKSGLNTSITNSGTRLAYAYAVKSKKNIINIKSSV